ncbi:hypothetical protein RFI_21009, partial [Reticulomyxa filosa]
FFFFFGWGRKNRVEITLDLDFKTYNNEEMHQMIAQELSEKALKGALAPQHIAVIDTREGSIIMIVAFSLSAFLLVSYPIYKLISFCIKSRQTKDGQVREWKIHDEVVVREKLPGKIVAVHERVGVQYCYFSQAKTLCIRPTEIQVQFYFKKFYWIRDTENFYGTDPSVQLKEPGVEFSGDVDGITIKFFKAMVPKLFRV